MKTFIFVKPFCFQHGIRAEALFLAALVRFWSSPVQSTVSREQYQRCSSLYRVLPVLFSRHASSPLAHAPPPFSAGFSLFAGDRFWWKTEESDSDLDLVLCSSWCLLACVNFIWDFWRRKKVFVDLVVSDSSCFRFLVLICASQFGSWKFWLPLLWFWCYFHWWYEVLLFGVLFELHVLELSSRSGGSQWWLHSGFVWDELLFVACFGMFWLLCVEHGCFVLTIFGFKFHLWFCIKFTDLLLMGSVEFYLFLGLSS